jgi:hypothetical protein
MFRHTYIACLVATQISLTVVDFHEVIMVEWTKSLDAAASDDPILPAPDQTGY